MFRYLPVLAFLLISFSIISCSSNKEGKMTEQQIKERVDSYARVVVSPDYSILDEGQQKVVTELLAAARLADEVFWRQSDHDAIATREAFSEKPGPVQDYARINYGPYDRIHEGHRFVGEGPKVKPKGAGFYPADMSREEFEKFVADHPEQKEALENLYSVVVRENGELKAVPYHVAYADLTDRIAKHLADAAGFATNPSLKKYLDLRAQAIQSDDYYLSDLAWMDLKDNLIDIVIGPIENYEDGMFNYKAAFEAAVMLKDVPASAELDVYKKYLDALEQNLPIESKYKKPSAGSGNVLEVVNIAYFGGDYQAGIKTIAASLPNDERVISERGAKKQLYKNIIEAKFDKILIPLADRLIAAEQRAEISREAFVSQVLLHELSHTLGPDYVYGTEQSVRRALKEKYSIIEECKADVLGIYHLSFLKDKLGLSDEDLARNYVTYLAGLFRSIRFGYKEAHGAANLIQLNFLEANDVVQRDEATNSYSVDTARFHNVISKLATELLMIEALGDYDEAVKLIAEMGAIQPHTLGDIHRLEDIPRDLDLIFED